MISSDFTQMMKKKDSAPGQLCLDQKYLVKSALGNYGQYVMFRGIDKQKMQWVYIYAKKAQSSYRMSASIKESVRNQLCPKLLWSGEIQTSKFHSFFEVHERYGPNLKTLFDTIRKIPKDKQLLHLLFEMIKLVEKMNSAKIVCGQLDPQTIVFDSVPSKNDLYLLNAFKLKKKSQPIKPMKTKYCSRGAHLGRNLTTKDDLESVCYILIDIFLEGKFLFDKTPSQFQETKLSEKIDNFASNLPKTLLDFYHYVISLNFTDEVNFFYWKNLLTKILTIDIISQPYTFMNKQLEQTESLLRCKDLNRKSDEKQIDEEIEQINQKVRQSLIGKCKNEK